jgi:predicted RNA-binding protein YlxR (DUF448 family)
MCVACRERADKSLLIRVGKGRGAYLHRNHDCLKLAVKKRCFERALKDKVNDEFYRELEEKINEH